MSRRVCMLIYHYWPGPEGGTERQCRRLATALTRRGVVCTVLTTRSSRGVPVREQDDGVQIVRVPTVESFRRRPATSLHVAAPVTASASPPARSASAGIGHFAAATVAFLNALVFQISAAAFLWRHSREFDLIHVHTAEWIAGFAVWIGRRLRLPVLCKLATLPALPPTISRVPFGKTWNQMRRHAEFVALNGAMAEELAAAGVPAQRIRVIPNSVGIPDVSLRHEDANTVLYVGNLSQGSYKAFDVLFDAWAMVHDVRPDGRLVVLGGGDASPWERYLEEHGCRASVSFEGYVRDVDTYYARAAMLVLPSRQEGMSNALLEALSWGIPAVVSDIPANRAVVVDGQNGLVVPVNNAAALAAGIIRLLGDAGLRNLLGVTARRRIRERYGVERVAEQTQKVYDGLQFVSG